MASYWAERSKPPPAEKSPERTAQPVAAWASDEPKAFKSEALHDELARVKQARGIILDKGDLGLEAHVLKRLQENRIFDVHPEISLADGIAATEKEPYRHAYERSDFEDLEPDENGAYNLDLYQYLKRDMEDLIHADPAIDLADLIALKKAVEAREAGRKA